MRLFQPDKHSPKVMNTRFQNSRRRSRRLPLLSGIALAFVSGVTSGTAHAQIFVANSGNGTIGEYTTSGATVNASLITGLNKIQGIAVSGSDLFVSTDNVGQPGVISEYTTSGALVNTLTFTNNGDSSGALAASGSDVYAILNPNTASQNTVKFTTSSFPSLSPPVGGPGHGYSIAVSGSDVFVLATQSLGGGLYLAEFTSSGSFVTFGLIPYFNPTTLPEIAVLGSDVLLTTGNTISEYTPSGNLVTSSFITGLDNASNIAVVSIPEPSTWALLAGCAMLAFAGVRRFRVKAAA
jgi:hypothetical protein